MLDAFIGWCVTHPPEALAVILLTLGTVIYVLDQLGFEYARSLRASGSLASEVDPEGPLAPPSGAAPCHPLWPAPRGAIGQRPDPKE